MPTSSRTCSNGEAPWVAEVRQVVRTWLQACDIAYPAGDVARDDELYRICYDAAVREGFPVEKSTGLSRYLTLGVNISTTAYTHLPDTSTRVWVALYTAFLAVVEDLFAEDVAPAQTFLRRMLSGEKQEHPSLEAMASILRKMSAHFDSVQDSIILTSTFNFIIALPVEKLMRGVELPPCAEPYAKWSSLLNGANEAYAMFVFPREVPFEAYAHAIPDMMTVIRNTNDILSLYKEEMDGDNGNHVSLVAQSRNISKLAALQAVADECIAAYRRVNETLLGEPVAHASWLSFAAGFVGFHTATKRYRLDELGVERA